MSGKMEQQKLCMLCCTNYRPSKQDKTNLGTRIRFRKFCRELECVLAEKGAAEGGPTKRQRQKVHLKGDLNLAYGDLTICPACMKLICVAVDARDDAKKLEVNVIELQKQLLEMLQVLDGYMAAFLQKMKKIESVVKSSDQVKLEDYIEENIAGHLQDDPIEFRQRILDAVTDLRIFRHEMTSKDIGEDFIKRKEQKLIEKRLQNLRNSNTQTVIRGDVISKEQHRPEKKSAVKVKCVMQQTDPIIILENEPNVTVKMEVEQVDIDPTDYGTEYVTPDFGDDNYNSEDNDQEQQTATVVRSARPRRSVTLRKPSRRDRSSDSDSEDSDCSVNDKSYKRKRRNSDADSNFSDEDPDMLRHKMDDEKRKLAVHQVDISHLPVYKRRVVNRVINRLKDNRSCNVSTEQSAEDGNVSKSEDRSLVDIHPQEKYKIRYVSETESLILENIEIICLESERSLQCSLCDHTIKEPESKSGGKSGEEFKMHNHILREHLGAFECPLCSASLKNCDTYMKHIKGHENPTICDICGKPLRNSSSIRSHKWTHMNEDEKADAIQRGMTDPKQAVLNLKNKSKTIPCGTCGKLFRTITEVQTHEQIHSEREKIPCHLCGKLLLSVTINSHTKYSCPGVKRIDGPVECHICHKTFKNLPTLKGHKAKVHPTKELPTCVCAHCGKTYKSNASLKQHMETHSEIAAHACSKCGAKFKLKKNVARHEKNCNGTARRRSNLHEREGHKVKRFEPESSSSNEHDYMNTIPQHPASAHDQQGHSSSSHSLQENFNNYHESNFFNEFFIQQRGTGGVSQ